MTVRIVTDSASDLTPGEAEALGVDIVPLSIRFGEEVFLDREELGANRVLSLLGDKPEDPLFLQRLTVARAIQGLE